MRSRIFIIEDVSEIANLIAMYLSKAGMDALSFGTAEAALLIQEGRMTSTSFQNAYALAVKNMELADQILTGKVTKLVDFDIDCPLITKDNIKDLIDAHKAAGSLK